MLCATLHGYWGSVVHEMYSRKCLTRVSKNDATKFGVPVKYNTHLVNSKYHEEEDVIVDNPLYPPNMYVCTQL